MTLLKTISLAGIALFSGDLIAQDWQLKKEKDDIKVYTRPVENSKFDEYKVVGIVNSSIENIVNIFQDEDDIKSLFADTKDAKVLQNDNQGKFVVYLRTNAPFPVSDRAASYENEVSYSDNGDAFIDIECNDEYYIKKKGVVKLGSCKGFWELEKIGDNLVKATHQMLADPAGSLPGWIVNRKTVNSPFYTLEKLKELAK